MERRYIFSLTGILFLISILSVFLFGCKKEPSELGTQFKVTEENLPVFVDLSSLLSFRNYTMDSILSYSYGETIIDEHLLGAYTDPVFEKRSASILFQFGLSTYNVVFDNSDTNRTVDLSVDSLILILDLSDYYYGDVAVPMHFLIYELSDGAPTPIYSTYKPSYDTTLLASVEFALSDYTSPHNDKMLRIRLSDSLAKKLLFADASNYLNDDVFSDFFPGLYIVPDPSYSNTTFTGVRLLTSKLSLYYYKITTLVIDTNTTITQEKLVYNFKLENKFPHATLFDNNYSSTAYFPNLNDSIEDDILFIQGSSGIYSTIDFSDLLHWRDSLHISLNSVTFTLKLQDTLNLDKYAPPSRLFLRIVNNDGSTVNEGVMYNFDGLYDKTKYQYVFEITKYILQLMKGSLDETSLQIIVYDESKHNYMNRVSLLGNSPLTGNVELKIVYVKI